MACTDSLWLHLLTKVRLLLDRLAVEARPLSPTRFATNTLINVGLVDPAPGARSVDPRWTASPSRTNGGRANGGGSAMGGGSPQSPVAAPASLRRAHSPGGRVTAPSAGGPPLGELFTDARQPRYTSTPHSLPGGRVTAPLRFAGNTLIHVAPPPPPSASEAEGSGGLEAHWDACWSSLVPRLSTLPDQPACLPQLAEQLRECFGPLRLVFAH